MGTPSAPSGRQPKTIPVWLAYVLFALVWGPLPCLVSLLTPRYGWNVGSPGYWNLLGLIPLAVGLAGSLRSLHLHARQSASGVDMEPDKNYLLTSGTYAYSRNPMYLSELTLLFGWVLFFGSIAVLILFLAWWALFVFYQVPREERTIEGHFGDTYRKYKSRVPRWFGRPRR
jgi:protein-S-isoprenylcysteine O-methyltransferase Ste14